MDAPIENAPPAVAEDAQPFRSRPDPRMPDPDRAARWAAWQAENAEAIDAWNDYVEEHGLPLAKYRVF